MYRYLLAIVLCATMIGCQTDDAPGGSYEPPEVGGTSEGVPAPPLSQQGLPMSPHQRFSDIPLPANMYEDLEHSYVYESKDLQIGRMVYDTEANTTEVAQFFIDECPAAGWHLESTVQAEGIQLVFRKPGKRLLVAVSPKRFSRTKQKVILHLTPDPSAGR